MNLNNQLVWITGASSGIGEELVYEVVRKKAKVIISSSGMEKLEKVAEKIKDLGGECFIVYMDMLEIDKIHDIVEQTVSQYGVPNILINNAGISQRSKVAETDLSVFRKLFEIDFFSQVELTKCVLPHMIKNNGGKIASTSSISGLFGFPLRSGYSAAKHAIHGFYESLRLEYLNDNIKVTIACPGRIKTNISMSAITSDGSRYGKMDQGQARGISARKCARKYLKAINRNKKEVLIGGSELLMAHFYRFCRPVFNFIVSRIRPV